MIFAGMLVEMDEARLRALIHFFSLTFYLIYSVEMDEARLRALIHLQITVLSTTDH